MYPSLRDEYTRIFRYLRLSLTDVCNFRCGYCLPNGYNKCDSEDPLNLEEIKNLVTGFIDLGIEKIRLTGGEPTLRRDLLPIIEMIKDIDANIKVALTTNGFSLPSLLTRLKASGLNALNISLDSLNAQRFAAIRGKNISKQILQSIDLALELGFDRVKVNAVLLKGENDSEIHDYLEWIKVRPISARFIELMRTNENSNYFSQHFISAESIKKQLIDLGWREVARSISDGPAREFSHPEYVGRIGLIAPYSKGFCESCNRLRVSAKGALRLCLFGDGDYSLRKFLQSPSQRPELTDAVLSALRLKPKSHRLNEENSGNMNSLSTIGG